MADLPLPDSCQRSWIVGDTSGYLRILTSGTTGEPRCVRYDWKDLLAQIRPYKAAADERWLLAYHLNHFAGMQMLAHVLMTESTLILPESTSVADNIRAMTEHRVTHISASPTFWRFALAQLDETQTLTEVRQITLGSEAVSQHLLDSLQERFSQARVVHIYASTEDGSCVSVADGRAGLPVSILSRGDGQQVQFRIVDGELHTRSVHGMLGYKSSSQDGEMETGNPAQTQWLIPSGLHSRREHTLSCCTVRRSWRAARVFRQRGAHLH